ncbi:MAG: hypothetical protein AB8E15_09670 [Bdellovibrionales bacterium]
MNNLCLSFFVLFLSLSLFASKENSFFFKDNEGYRIVTTYFSEGKYFLDEYQLKYNQFQRRIGQNSFGSKEELEQELNKFLRDNKSLEVEQAEIKWTAPKTDSVIWEATEDWNAAWEERFISWVQDNFHKDFFVDYEIETDCADVAYALRWIFSRINHLSVGNRLAGSLTMFTNRSLSPRWEHLPTHENWYEDQRFLAALNYLMNNTYTVTLSMDTYPVALTKEALTSSTIFMPYSGHTTIFKTNSEVGGTRFGILSSTVPRRVRSLHLEYSFNAQPDNRNAGLRKFRSYNSHYNNLRAPENMPFYSMEQYDPNTIPNGTSFNSYIFQTVFEMSFYDVCLNSLESIKSYLTGRIGLVHEGYEFCSSNSCEEGGVNYENWSTPSRDRRTRNMIRSFQSDIEDLSQENYQKIHEAMEPIRFQVTDTDNRSLSSLMNLFRGKNFESDPNLTPDQRWGGVLPIEMGIESEHPYTSRRNKLYSIVSGNLSIVTIDIEYVLEEGYDFIYFFVDGREQSLSGEGRTTLVLEGENIKMQFFTDYSSEEWGYLIHDIQIRDITN